MKNSTQLRRCTDCPNMTRPSRTLVGAYDIPTTQRHGELCIRCYRLTIKRTGTDPEPRPSIEEIQAGLDAFLRRRHEREAMMMRREFAAERLSA